MKGTPIEPDAMVLGAMYASGYFKDLNSLSKAITKALIGKQMGMDVVSAMNSLYVIDGRVAMDSHAVRNTAVMAGYSIKTVELTKDQCVLEWSYKGEVLGFSEFTWEDAQMAGLTGKSNWKTYPKDMLFARAITRGARMYANQAFANQAVYDRDELAGGSGVIDVLPVDPRVERIRQAESTDDIKQLVSELSPEDKRALAHVISDRLLELSYGTAAKK